MTKQQQFIKNIDLSKKLAEYLASHPMEADKLPDNASFVAFTEQDIELNTVNTKLIEGLLEEGKKVVKAIFTNDKTTPWKLTAVN